MQLLAAARVEELRAQAATLAPGMERRQAPVEYLANPELAQALRVVHNARTSAAVEAADATVKERMFLIGKDGINGPDIDQLRQETTANITGAGDTHFEDPDVPPSLLARPSRRPSSREPCGATRRTRPIGSRFPWEVSLGNFPRRSIIGPGG
jgi:hypothetical protein